VVPDGYGRTGLVILNRAPAVREVCACGLGFDSVEQRPTVDAKSDPHSVRNEVTLKHPVAPLTGGATAIVSARSIVLLRTTPDTGSIVVVIMASAGRGSHWQ